MNESCIQKNTNDRGRETSKSVDLFLRIPQEPPSVDVLPVRHDIGFGTDYQGTRRRGRDQENVKTVIILFSRHPGLSQVHFSF